MSKEELLKLSKEELIKIIEDLEDDVYSANEQVDMLTD